MSRTQRGQGLVEYALLLALVAIVAIAALFLFGRNLYHPLLRHLTEALQFGCGQVSHDDASAVMLAKAGPAPPGGITPGLPARPWAPMTQRLLVLPQGGGCRSR